MKPQFWCVEDGTVVIVRDKSFTYHYLTPEEAESMGEQLIFLAQSIRIKNNDYSRRGK